MHGGNIGWHIDYLVLNATKREVLSVEWTYRHYEQRLRWVLEMTEDVNSFSPSLSAAADLAFLVHR